MNIGESLPRNAQHFPQKAAIVDAYRSVTFRDLHLRSNRLANYLLTTGIAKGDISAVELLMQVLLLSGLGMTIAGGSYPASQAEHMIAHGETSRVRAASRHHADPVRQGYAPCRSRNDAGHHEIVMKIERTRLHADEDFVTFRIARFELHRA